MNRTFGIGAPAIALPVAVGDAQKGSGSSDGVHIVRSTGF